MKILALLGSPRKGGNSETLVDAFIAGAESNGAVVEKVRLNSLKIRGCQACLSCHKTGKCVQKDDMLDIHAKLLEFDAWLFATPVYWWGPTAQIKAAMDRMYCFAYGDNPKIIEGKRVALISTFADTTEAATPHLLGMYRDATDFIKMKWVGEVLVQAGAKGEAAKNSAALDKARQLGARVAVEK